MKIDLLCEYIKAIRGEAGGGTEDQGQMIKRQCSMEDEGFSDNDNRRRYQAEAKQKPISQEDSWLRIGMNFSRNYE